MSRILLDTSGYSTLIRGLEEAARLVRQAYEIHFTPVVLGELHVGFERGSKQKSNLQDLERFLSSPRVQIDAIDPETSKRYAAIFDDLRRRGTPVPVNDIWIAASAMQHGLTVVTADIHFLSIPQVVTQFIQTS